MRILVWSGSYAPGIGGVEVVVQGLARSLADRGDRVEVMTQGPAGTSLEAEGSVHRLPFHEALSSRDPSVVASLGARVTAIVRRFAPDLVHAHAVHPSEFFLLRTLDAVPVPLIFTLHGWTALGSGRDTLRERMLRLATGVTGCSRHVVNEAVRAVPEIAARATTIYNGCRDPGLAIEPLPFDPPHLLFVGRLVESKGVDRLLHAFRVVLARHPSSRLTIVGDGPLRVPLEQECGRLGIADRTRFEGAVSRARVFDGLNRATLLVVPSHGGAEGLPMVALEASLMARPIVAARDGGLPEAVVDGRTGFLVQDEDPNSLAHAMLRVLDSRALAVDLGREGRRHALARFDWDAQMAAYARTYEKTAEEWTRR